MHDIEKSLYDILYMHFVIFQEFVKLSFLSRLSFMMQCS